MIPGLIALAAIVARTTHYPPGATLDDIAAAEKLSRGQLTDAQAVLRHAPDLVQPVAAGTLRLSHAAIVARLRRDVPAVAARVEWGLVTDGKPGAWARGQGRRLRATWALRYRLACY